MSELRLAVTVSQGELEEICKHRRELAFHKKSLERLEKDTIHLLLAGADIEPGRFIAKVKFQSRHAVSWKELVISEFGQEFADHAWKNSRLIRIPQLELIEHPYMPLWDRKAS